ncbi:hypothetical protein ABZ281_05905 [Streptomyces sp. NPDC006265]|uniref:hypothetical protein n=1 Tax=Streptomyces sp. NPDC006265 TaxID=3156740 RepID=UPI0033A9B180
MADVMGTVKGKTLVAQTSAVLLTRGLEVEPVAVRNVIAHMVDTVAERVGMDAEEAIHLVTSEAVADAIVAVNRPGFGRDLTGRLIGSAPEAAWQTTSALISPCWGPLLPRGRRRPRA